MPRKTNQREMIGKQKRLTPPGGFLVPTTPRRPAKKNQIDSTQIAAAATRVLDDRKQREAMSRARRS